MLPRARVQEGAIPQESPTPLALVIIGGLGRVTFNALLLGIILAILAIPVTIGLLRLSHLYIPVVEHVPTATVRPIPTAYPGYQVFTASPYTISVPSNWTQNSSTRTLSPGGVAQEQEFDGPASSDTAFTVTTLQSVPADQLESLLENITINLAQARVDNFQTVSSPQPGGQIDGQATLREEFTVDASTGQGVVQLEGDALVLNHALTSYVVLYLAPAAQFSAIQQQYFAPMLASMRLRG